MFNGFFCKKAEKYVCSSQCYARIGIEDLGDIGEDYRDSEQKEG